MFKYNKIILIIAAIVTAVALVRVVQLKFEWDLLKYAPQDASAIKAFNESIDTFGSPHYVLVTLESKEGATTVAFDEFVEKLVDALAKSPHIKRTEDILPDRKLEEIRDFALRHILLYLSPEDMDLIKKRLSPAGIKRAVSRMKRKKGNFLSRLFTNPIDLLIIDPLQSYARSKDPFNLNSLARKYFIPRDLKFMKHRGGKFYVSLDRKMLFFLIEPAEPWWNMPATEKLIEDMNNTLSLVAADHELKDARVSFAGYHTIGLENYRDLKKDTFLTLIVTSIGVIIIFLIGFRNIRFLPYAVLPLAVPLIWTLGLASQLYGSINLFTCILAILILGLGIDFAIHLLNGYRVAKIAEMKSEDAWRASLKSRGPAVLCGAFTTIAVFSLLMISDFSGVRQLGLLVSIGLILVLICVFFLMPAIIGIKEIKSEGLVKSPWLGVIIRKVSLAHPKKIAVIALVFTAIIGYYVYPLEFSSESVEPYSKSSPSVATIERFAERVGVFPEYMLAVSHGRTIPEVLETSYRLQGHLAKLQKEGHIAQFDSPSRYLPPYDIQQRNLSVLKDTPELNPETFRKNFLTELNARKISSKYLRVTYLPMVEKALGVQDIVELDDIEALGLSDRMKRYISKGKDEYELATYIFYRKKAFDQTGATAAMNKISENPLIEEGKVRLIGSPMINKEMREILTKNLKLIFICAIVAVLIILFIYFRRIKFVLLATVPVLFSVIAMLAVFKLVGYELNFFNAIWLALILGIGIDSGVHMISGYRVPEDDREASLGEVGRAITMSTLTTLTAFGSMTLAILPGLRSSGVLAGSGMIFSLIASIFILPGLLKLFNNDSIGRIYASENNRNLG
jgi:predicted RND superfamily exporter protein